MQSIDIRVLVLAACHIKALELGPFPIHVCGATSRPTPYMLPLYKCNDKHKLHKPEVSGRLNLMTRAHLAVPLEARKCHAIVAYTSCMEWFLGVKDIKYWVEGSVVTKEECINAMEDNKSLGSIKLISPKPRCIWWGNNTLRLRQVLVEPITVFANLLSDVISLPGHNNSWDFLSSNWHYSDSEYYYLPEPSVQIYNLHHQAAEIETSCVSSSHRVTCPDAAITFWIEDLTIKHIKGHEYYEVNPSIYIRKDLSADILINSSLIYLNKHRHGDPTLQYLLMRIDEVREATILTQDLYTCELENMRRMTALALAPINPVMAGLVYLGERYPGVSISQGGLIKYSCSEVMRWVVDTTLHGYKDLPIIYELPQYPKNMSGFLDSTSLYIKATSVPGVPPQFLLINSTHLFNVKTMSFILPVSHNIVFLLAKFPVHGVASYSENELEALSSLTHVAEWLTHVTQPMTRRYVPDSHVIFALKDTPARDVVRTSQAWFANLIPNTLSIVAEVVGSLITLIIASQLILAGLRWVLRLINTKLYCGTPRSPQYELQEIR